MTVGVATFFRNLFRSVFISAVISLIIFSVITREFPPDFGRLQNGYEKLKALEKASTKISSAARPAAGSEEEEIHNLIESYKERGEATQILNERMGAKKKMVDAVSDSEPEDVSPQDLRKMRREIELLKARVLTLEDRLRTEN